MKRKHIVRVVLVSEVEVDIEVECEDDEDPTDLTPQEESKAKSLAPAFADWSAEWSRCRVLRSEPCVSVEKREPTQLPTAQPENQS